MKPSLNPVLRVRTRFNHPFTPKPFVAGDSMAQEHIKEYSDINILVQRFTRAGITPSAAQQGQFLDLTSPFVSDLMSAENMLLKAHQGFMGLPAETRLKFGNNAVNMASWLSDEKNHDEARKMGLLPALKEPAISPDPKPSEPAPKPPEGG